MRLFIDGKLIELRPDVTIAKTLQVNDIGSANTRQTNYTNTFSIPKTANNIKAFDRLGIVGNNSKTPYKKNRCDLFTDSGEAIVYNGWAIITSTDKDFKCNIYDGVIDLYKSIENKSLADLDLSLLKHDKTVDTVKNSQDLSKPYVYIFADYNGKAIHSNKINVDYLVPSVKVSWLFDKIQSNYGFTINGSFKTNPDFTNLYITYPKASPPIVGSSVLTSSNLLYVNEPSSIEGIINSYAYFSSTSLLDTSKVILSADKQTITAVSNIKLKVSFVINPSVYVDRYIDGQFIDRVPCGGSFLNNQFICDGTQRQIVENISLVAGQSFKFTLEVFYDPNESSAPIFSKSFVSVDLKELTNAVLFEQEFGALQIKQFLNEILWMFNLTIFKDQEENSYTFKYLSEVLNATPIDWSNKFQELESESYTYGSYGQRNWLRHKYNDENSYFNDGYISIDNQLLPDSKNIIGSIVYSPEYNQSTNLGFSTNIYRLWNKEIKDNGSVDYKTLSNRFYFLRATQTTGTFQIISEVLSETTSLTTIQKENYSNLKYSTIQSKYYEDFASILNSSKLQTVSLRLNERDIVNMDFSKPVYIKQLGGSYLVNKINNFVPYKDTKVELIKIQPKFINAVNDTFQINTIFSQQLFVMSNDYLNATSANITSINTTGFTLGTLSITSGGQSITFVPNGTNGTKTFKYTITNNLGVVATATVTVITNILQYVITNNSLITEPTLSQAFNASSTQITVNVASKSFKIGVKVSGGTGLAFGSIDIGGQAVNINTGSTSYVYSAPFTLTQGVYNSSTFYLSADWQSGAAVTGHLILIEA